MDKRESSEKDQKVIRISPQPEDPEAKHVFSSKVTRKAKYTYSTLRMYPTEAPAPQFSFQAQLGLEVSCGLQNTMQS